jgi:polar amino acid transport system substrate-binding protein
MNDTHGGFPMYQRFSLLAALVLAASCATTEVARAPAPSADVVKALAPTGKLRAAINYGNPVLAQKDAATGQPKGVSVDLARELARRLGVPVEFVTYDAAGKVTAAAKSGVWDIGFVAIDPQRAQDIVFTGPYVNIEGGYMVKKDSPLKAIDEFDRKGMRIAVGNKSVYDLYLTRTIKNAELVRLPTSPGAMEALVPQNLDAAAGVKEAMSRYAAANPGLRMIPGRFMVIEQAMAIPRGPGEAGLGYVKAFVEEQKATGFVARGLERSGQLDATVAPATTN